MLNLEFSNHFVTRMLAVAFHNEALRKKMERVMRPGDWSINAARYVWIALLTWQRDYGTFPTPHALEEYLADCVKREVALECDNAVCILQQAEYEYLAAVIGQIMNMTPQAAEAEAPYYAARLREYLEHTRVSAVMSEVGTAPVREQTDACATALKELASVFDRDVERYPVIALYDRACLSEDHAEKVPLGIPELDEILGGGLSVGEIGMVMASTGVGKTNALLHSAICAGYNGKHGLFLSLELGRKSIMQRGVAMAASVPISYFRTTPEARQPKDVDAMSAVLGPDYPYRDSLFMVEMTDHCPSVEEIESKIVEWKAHMAAKGHAPETCRLVAIDWLEYIDYSKNMGRDKGSAGMASALQKVMQDLRQVAQRQQVAIITATQLNREAEGREAASLKYASHSYAMTNVCDLVLTLCPQAPSFDIDSDNTLPMPTNDHTSFQQMNMQIAKIRNAHGRNHIIELTRSPSLSFCGGTYEYTQARNAVARKDWSALARVISGEWEASFKR